MSGNERLPAGLGSSREEPPERDLGRTGLEREAKRSYAGRFDSTDDAFKFVSISWL